MDLNTVLLLAAVALLAIVFIKSIFGRQGNDSSALLLDLKNQLADLKAKQQESASEALNKQLEAEKKSLVEQQNLFRETQKANSLQMEGLIKIVNDNLAKTQNNLTQQLGQTQTTVTDVQKKLVHLQEATKNIMDVGKDISSLQNILQAPKLRGSLGEFLLEELLRQILPTDHFTMQYRFADDQRVDAVIQLNDGLIPVDSKFPLESFQRLVEAQDENEKLLHKKTFIAAVKKHIDDIAEKYIRPAEKTFDFALMYIPAENVYYETILNDSLTNKEYEIMNHAMKKRVVPVSPNSFYAYLQCIVFGLRGFQIEEKAKIIMSQLSQVQKGFSDFYGDFQLLGKHLGNAQGKYDESVKRVTRLHGKIGEITGDKGELDGIPEKKSVGRGEKTQLAFDAADES